MLSFDDLIDRKRIMELIEQGQGQGVKVGILDSGIDPDHTAFKDATIHAREVVEQRGDYLCRAAPGSDTIGHGTMCAGVIHEIAPKAEIFSIKVLDHDKPNSPVKVIRGIEWATANNLHVLNLSLASVNMTKNTIADMLTCVDKAYYQGTILVAATDNKQKRGFPGDYASVIGVDFQHFESFRNVNFRLGKAVEIEAKGVYVDVPIPGNQYMRTTCTSIACPHVTGLVARLMSSLPGLTPFQAKTLLMCIRSNRQEA